jgi:hypothetical protein
MTKWKPLRRVCCALIFGTCLAVCVGRCDADQPAPPSSTSTAEPVLATTEFPKNLWTVDLFGSYIDRFIAVPHEMAMGTAGFNCYFLDNISMGCEFNGIFAPQPDDATGVGLAYSMRGHFLRGDGWSMYLDTALGLVDFDAPTPLGGSHFNFTVGVGGGMTLRMTPRLDLMLGARFFHESNAGLDGVHRNPSFNGGQGYVGLMFKL